MKLSRGFWQTYKEVPAEAELPSHRFMLRAGMILKSTSGIYSHLPMGLRVIRKIETIVREELDKIDCCELEMGLITPGDLWQETGRWDVFGPLMLKMQDRNGRDLCFGPTHEETITDIFRKTIKSYKELPLTLYQITPKFRDELRPRYGLMRCREFSMMDAYSFHLDSADLDKTYNEIYGAYTRIFTRLGLKFIVVEADGGAMAGGGGKTHEFQVLASAGEDEVIKCSSCSYASNSEKSESKRMNSVSSSSESQGPMEEVSTPGRKSIEDVSAFFKTTPDKMLKSLFYMGKIQGEEEWRPYILCLRGDDILNELKFKNALNLEDFFPAKEADFRKYNLTQGFLGPLQLSKEITLIFDREVPHNSSYITGAQKEGYHLKNFVPKRELSFSPQALDLRLARAGDRCPKCQSELQALKGIEVGHIFQLGDKYSQGMKASVLNQQGKPAYPLMGCYGIGITRSVAAAIEQCHDEVGIIWPKSIAPYHIYLAKIGKSDEIAAKALELYDELTNAGYEVLYDDRGRGPGAMLKDADLLGLPLQLIVGERELKSSGEIELKTRKTKEAFKLKPQDLLQKIKELWPNLD